jgi:hypothetical protein
MKSFEVMMRKSGMTKKVEVSASSEKAAMEAAAAREPLWWPQEAKEICEAPKPRTRREMMAVYEETQREEQKRWDAYFAEGEQLLRGKS